MRFGPPFRILAAAGLLAVALVGLVVRENVAREQGQEVRLALAGYDPRSLLQGHYVQFQLRESRPGEGCPRGSLSPGRGSSTWIALRREGDHHRAVGAAATRAEAARLGEVTVQGRMGCYADRQPVSDVAGAATQEVAILDLDLGVDRLHLDQAQAEAMQADLQRATPGGTPPGYAVLSVGRDGKARVKGLIVGARRVDLDWF